MRRFEQDIEFNDDFQPVIGKGTEIFTAALPCLVAIASYLLVLDLSLLLVGVLIKSPIVVILSALLGIIAVIAGWFLSFLLFGLLGGNFEFAKSVFFLFNDVYFRVSIIVLFISAFLTRTITGVIARASFSYSARTKLFWALLIIILLASGIFHAFVNGISDCPGKYYFIYLLLGIVYLYMGRGHNQERPASKSRFYKNRRPKQKEKIDYSWQDLRDVFQDL